MISGQFIVLDKRPFRESALLLGCFGPDSGKMSFVLHGGQKLSEKNFPAADLFRELEISFPEEDQEKELSTAKEVTLLTEFDAIASDPRAFKMAGRIASFLLKNSAPSLPQPYTYDTLRSVLANLAKGPLEHEPWDLEQCSVLLKTAHLYENGLLPEPSGEKQGEFLENLVASGIDNAELPSCRPEYWNTLNGWLNSLIEYHHLKR